MSALTLTELLYTNEPADRLAVTGFVALIAHIIIVFGLGFEFSKPGMPLNDSMEIILVQTTTHTAPEKGRYLAQTNQEGGGEVDEDVRPTAVTPAPFPDANPLPVASAPPEQRAAQETKPQPGLMTATQANERIYQPEPEAVVNHPVEESTADETLPPSEQLDAVDLIMEAQSSIASLQASLDEKFNAYSKRPRERFIGASTREYRFAGYMENWRRKIERIGTINYPEEARHLNLTGELVLDVAIFPNGTVSEIKISIPSRHEILNEAAKNIVRLAAPFSPFPEAISRDTDILHITRRWQFSAEGVSSAF